MSAGSGIYILRTKEGQNRVVYAQTINNIYWDNKNWQRVKDHIFKTMVEYFGKCKYTYDGNKAMNIATTMFKQYPVLEYGIRIIPVDMTWKQIVDKADKADRVIEHPIFGIYNDCQESTEEEYACIDKAYKEAVS